MGITRNGRQRGATLLEALAFLGIAAVVVVGALAMYRGAQGSAQSNEMVRSVTGLRSALKTMFATQGRYGSATWSPTVATQALNRAVIQSGSLPDSVRATAAGDIFDLYTGQIRIDGDEGTFWVRYERVPKDVCMKAGANTDTSWVGLAVNGAYSDLSVASASMALPSLVTQCLEGERNVMIWRGR